MQKTCSYVLQFFLSYKLLKNEIKKHESINRAVKMYRHMYLGNVTVFSGNVTLTVELLLEKNF